jgi:5-methylcytosine-specific restriction endonuclease McrA
VINRWGSQCYLCGRKSDALEYEIEHIIPRSQGGSDHLHNLGLACKPCNRTKLDYYVSIAIADRMPCYWLSR